MNPNHTITCGTIDGSKNPYFKHKTIVGVVVTGPVVSKRLLGILEDAILRAKSSGAEIESINITIEAGLKRSAYETERMLIAELSQNINNLKSRIRAIRKEKQKRIKSLSALKKSK